MGVKSKSRLIAVLIAAVMVFTSAVGVFATEESVKQGTNQANKTVTSPEKGTIKVSTSGKVTYSTNHGKTWKTAKTSTITGLKKGKYVIVKTDEGTSYRWVKTVKVTKNKKDKVTWKKVKGAKYYMVRITDKKGKVTWKKTKKTSYKVGKGKKVRIRPVTKKKGHVYAGALCKTKKVK